MIPNPWVILGALAFWAVTIVGGGAFWGHHVSLSYEAALAKQATQAATTLAAETAKSAAKDAAYAELANRLDQEHAKALSDIESTRADFSERLRIAASRPRGCSPATPAPANPSGSAPVTDGGNRGSGGVDIAAGQRLRDYALTLQAYAVSCHSWAMSVGR